MNRLFAATAVCVAIGLAPAASQAAVTFTSYGVALPPGEHLVTDFSTASGLTGGNLVTGSVSGQYAAPAFSASTFDTSQYLEVPGGQSATLTIAPVTKLSIYLGSLDTYNTLTFGGPGGATFSGSQLGAISGAADGNQTAADTNGRFTFSFAAPVTSVTFSSSQNAFEVADVAVAAPEPATWAVMLLGFAGVGSVLRRARRSASLA